MISIPFSGTKKNSYKRIKEIVTANNYSAVYEPFGGSGVLSVNLFNDGLVNKAVVNDYDNFFDHYETYLDYKDLVVKECYERGLRKTRHDKDGYYYFDNNGNKIRQTQMSLDKAGRDILQTVIRENVPEEYWRYLALGTNFTWSLIRTHDFVRLCDFNLFTSQLTTDKQRVYLKVINEIDLDSLDWKEFIDKYKNEIEATNSLLILDPPYINTDQRHYKGAFSEADTLNLIETVKRLNTDFIFFNHDLQKVKEWFSDTKFSIEQVGGIDNSFSGYRKDVLVYVHKTP